MNIPEHQDHLRNIAAFRERISNRLTLEAFLLLDIALCGHMNHEQQAAFLRDIRNRGLLADN